MLQPILNSLNAKNIVLASTSPRRKMLLENIGLKFDIVPSKFEENLKKSDFKAPLDYVWETAKQKTLEVVNRLYSSAVYPGAITALECTGCPSNLCNSADPDETAPAGAVSSGSSLFTDLIIGADTIVTMDGQIYEKPSSRENAVSILKGFSGGSHTVYTSVVLVTPSHAEAGTKYNLVQFHEETEVCFANLDQHTIEAYVDTGEAMDKAGGYGIQGVGSTLITGVKGDYFNVIGFPLHQFCIEVLKLFPPK